MNHTSTRLFPRLLLTVVLLAGGAACSSTSGNGGAAGTGAGRGGSGATGGTQVGAAGTAGTSPAGSAGSGGGTAGGAGTSAAGSSGGTGASGIAGTGGSAAGASGTGGISGAAGSGGTATSDAGAGAGGCKPDLGYALQFRGTGDDRVHAAITKLPINQEPRTIELWAYFDGTSNSWRDEHGLFEYGVKNNCPGVAGSQCCHEFGINTVAWNGNGPGEIHPYGNCPEVDNFFKMPADVMKTGWVHLSFSYDAAAKQLHFTVNGDDMLQVGVEGGRTHAIGLWPGSTFSTQKSELRIGTTDDFSGPPGWQGKIDELRVWNVYRTPQQIKDNMRVLLQGNEPGLVAYYHFDEGSGLSSKDATGDSSNAALFVGTDKATWPMWIKSDIPGSWTCAQ